jgi:hypothetical protein
MNVLGEYIWFSRGGMRAPPPAIVVLIFVVIFCDEFTLEAITNHRHRAARMIASIQHPITKTAFFGWVQ